MPPPMKRPPPPRLAQPAEAEPARSFSVGTPKGGRGERIVIYGEGGIGKTSLAALAPSPIFLNFDNNPHLPNGALEVHGVETFADALAALRQDLLWAKAETVVIDTASAAQDLAIAHVLATIKHEKGHACKSIEDYGYGKGYRHLYESMLMLLAAVDRHAERGRHVVLICHDLAQSVPNPDGEDFLQYQPNLMSNGKTCLLRDRVKGWCDHMFFLKYDLDVNEDGKARGAGSRAIYPQFQATFWAKSRPTAHGVSLRDPIVFEEGSDELWATLFNKESI